MKGTGAPRAPASFSVRKEVQHDPYPEAFTASNAASERLARIASTLGRGRGPLNCAVRAASLSRERSRQGGKSPLRE
jgi:hypothetical protein